MPRPVGYTDEVDEPTNPATEVAALKEVERREVAGIAAGAVLGSLIAMAGANGATVVVASALVGAVLLGAVGFLWSFRFWEHTGA